MELYVPFLKQAHEPLRAHPGCCGGINFSLACAEGGDRLPRAAHENWAASPKYENSGLRTRTDATEAGV